jgi:hypothetical protein
LATVRANLAARGLTPQVHYVDAGYISAGQLAASAAAGVALVGPPLRDTSPHCFKLPDFTLDYAAKQAVCPNGNVSAKWVNRTERDGSRAFGITFRATDCAHCPLHADCTSAKGGRTLHINEHYPLLAERRLAMANPAFRAELAHRAGIEATLSELVRVHGLRRHRYRGDAQRHHENLLKAAACNLKRLTRVLAGPWATQNLADLGAEVIKVERPGAGDDTRSWGPPFLKGADGKDTREAGYYLAVNRGKRSITVSLDKPEGQRIVRELALKADIVLENYKAGTLERYGLDEASLRKVNPRLIYCSVTGFGQTGPKRQAAAYDFMIQAMGGLMSITGERDDMPGGGPQKVGIPIVDIMTGMYAAVGVL